MVAEVVSYGGLNGTIGHRVKPCRIVPQGQRRWPRHCDAGSLRSARGDLVRLERRGHGRAVGPDARAPREKAHPHAGRSGALRLRGYYLQFANCVLWPVFHYRVNLAEYGRERWAAYGRVNEMFAERLA